MRLAFQSKCDCADVLICSGRFDNAKEMLNSALMIDLSLAPLKAPVGGAASLLPLKNSNSGGGVWKVFRFVILRKLLLCARVLNDYQAYVETALRLLDSDTTGRFASSVVTLLFRDIVAISDGKIPSNSLVPENVLQGKKAFSEVMVSSMHPHASVSISFDHLRSSEPSQYTSAATVSVHETTKIIHDEPFKVRG
jgi:hypothetical protein